MEGWVDELMEICRTSKNEMGQMGRDLQLLIWTFLFGKLVVALCFEMQVIGALTGISESLLHCRKAIIKCSCLLR